MALPEGVTTATVIAGVPVTHTGAPVKAFVSIEPSAYLVHAATGTPLVDFLEELDISEGVAGQFILPHTDQAGFIDSSGASYTNWYYTAKVTYSTPSKAKNKSPKVKIFQLTTGQTTVDLDLLPEGAPALPYIAPTATVNAFQGRTGAVTLLESDLPARLAEEELLATFVASTGALQRLRDAGDGMSAAVDVRHRGTSGYVFHAVTEAGSGGFIQAYGTDEGTAGAVLRSHKNSAASEHAIQHGGASMLNYWQGYSNSSLLHAEVYKGNQGIKVLAKTGQGFGDGVTTSGSTTFTSAAAAFVAGDVGKAITQTTTRGSVAPSGSIPAGTTIVSVESGTSVTLSQPAGATGTTIPFLIAGRVPDVTQPLLTFYDDNGTTVLGQVRRSGVDFYTTTDTSAAAVSITSGGVFAARFGSSISNVKAPTQNGITVTNYQTGMHTAFFKGVAGQTGDQLHIEDSTGTLLSRVDKAGYFMTRKSAAPILGDMANNEAAWHVVGTAGAEKIIFTIRNSAGALVTKELV